MTFGERLKECRQYNWLSISDLSKITGVSTALIRHYENDRSEPSLFKIACIATALGVSIDYLAGLSDKK